MHLKRRKFAAILHKTGRPGIAKQLAKEKLNLKPGDRIVITGGTSLGESGKTNTIRVEII